MVNSKLAENSYLPWNYFWINHKLQRFSLKTVSRREIESLWEEQSSTQQLCGWALIFYFACGPLPCCCTGSSSEHEHSSQTGTQAGIARIVSATLLPFGLLVQCSLQAKLEYPGAPAAFPSSLPAPSKAGQNPAVTSCPWAALMQCPRSSLQLLSPVVCVQEQNGTAKPSLLQGKSSPALKPFLCSQPFSLPSPHLILPALGLKLELCNISNT